MNLCIVIVQFSKQFLNKSSKPKYMKQWLQTAYIHSKMTKAGLHITTPKYPPAKPIQLPENLKSIGGTETARFSPLRNRDLNGPAILCHASSTQDNKCYITESNMEDPHVESYDCMGAVNLCSSMQTNVPIPFSSRVKPTHLNMPGGQWAQSNKFLAEDMHNVHYLNIKRYMSQYTSDNKKLTQKEKLKLTVTQYGTTVIVFHVGISLLSLGGFYLAVSSGLDVASLLSSLGFGNSVISSKLATNTGTFVTAYAIHKIFAPVRISITLASTPFIVTYLRKIRFLKTSKVAQ